jgi:hypothetical protein
MTEFSRHIGQARVIITPDKVTILIPGKSAVSMPANGVAHLEVPIVIDLFEPVTLFYTVDLDFQPSVPDNRPFWKKVLRCG